MRKQGGRVCQDDAIAPAVRPEFVAAVRYADGRSELVHIHNTLDLADARALVLAELSNVKAVLIAIRRS